MDDVVALRGVLPAQLEPVAGTDGIIDRAATVQTDRAFPAFPSPDSDQNDHIADGGEQGDDDQREDGTHTTNVITRGWGSSYVGATISRLASFSRLKAGEYVTNQEDGKSNEKTL